MNTSIKKLNVKDGKHIHHNESGTTNEGWYKNGVLHREDGPAFIRRRKKFILFTQWLINGKLHREDGPAFVINYDSGFTEDKYYIYGIEYTKENFENAKNILNLNKELNQEFQKVKNNKGKKLKV